MVQVGQFTVNLVRADTKQVFKEHTGQGPNHNVYAEVEPGVDYFVQVASARGFVIVTTKVDGVDLGYWKNFTQPGNGYFGSWELTNGESKTTALRFNSAARASKQANSSMLTGKVEVNFYERGVDLGPVVQQNVAQKQLSSDMKVSGKKCVLSGNGSQVLKNGDGCGSRSYQLGELLCTITLHYCTAVGLILNKILDAPPSSQESDNNESPSKRAKVKPEKKRSATAAMLPSPEEKESNKKVSAAIDLTGDDDDGGNERWL